MKLKINSINLFLLSITLLIITLLVSKNKEVKIYVNTFNSQEITDLTNLSSSMLISSLKNFSTGKYVKLNYTTKYEEQIRLVKNNKGENYIALYPIGSTNPLLVLDTVIVGTPTTDLEIQANPDYPLAYFEIIHSETFPADSQRIELFAKLSAYFKKYFKITIDSSVILKTVHFSSEPKGVLLKTHIADPFINFMIVLSLILITFTFINLVLSIVKAR
jgi:hypothetical protein